MIFNIEYFWIINKDNVLVVVFSGHCETYQRFIDDSSSAGAGSRYGETVLVLGWDMWPDSPPSTELCSQ